ncbi:MAG: PilW family protein [Nitrospirae bacterium]|nr:PilW family protein [Candidatus Troglogloeales bacterium]
MKSKGLSLIEIMVAVALVGITTAAGYTFYRSTFKFQTLQGSQKDARMRLQLTMGLLASDIKAAGFGAMDPRYHGEDKGSVRCAGLLEGTKKSVAAPVVTMPPAVCDPTIPVNGPIPNPVVTPGNNAGAPDTITLVERNQFVGTLAADTAPVLQNAQITVTPSGGVGTSTIKGGDLITVGGFFSSVVGADPVNNVIPLVTRLQAQDTFTAGMDVYTVSTIAYTIGGDATCNGEPALLRQVGVVAINNPPTLVACGIEDMQIAYYLTGKQANGNVIPVAAVNDPPANNTAFLAVRVSLVARFVDPNPQFLGGQALTLEDHVPAVAPDRFRRIVITRVLELINDGCQAADIIC